MNIVDNTVNIIGRIDPKKKGEIGTNEFTEQIKEQMDKYAGINIDDKEDGQHAICDLQYVLGYSGTVKTDCKGINTSETPIKRNMKLVTNLTPDNIGADLPNILKDLDNTMILQGQYFIVAHLPYDDSKNIKAGGRMMLVKFLDNEDKLESYTSYDNVQSTDHKITLGTPEKYILINGKYVSNKKSATKIQSIVRGNKERQNAKTVRAKNEAAEKIQALMRGRKVRQAIIKREKEDKQTMDAANKRNKSIQDAFTEKHRLAIKHEAEARAQAQRQAEEEARAQAQIQARAQARARARAEEEARAQARAQAQRQARAQEEARAQAETQIQDVVKTQVAKQNAIAAFQELKSRLPKRPPIRRLQGALVKNEEYTTEKATVISEANKLIAAYNSKTVGETKKIPELKLSPESNRDIILRDIDEIINTIDSRKAGGKSTRRRRKLNPTRKLRTIKQNTKRMFKKGVSKRRKTRNKN
jgi:hypothetical protein